ncbi:MAG TPA: 3-hydroxyacyl-CoA dehydrogenase, partial [Aliiroseovarius sp.]|nr:3-hydroxyacyl-CoA dehydrogenase [Aliiroseovarius sp.]
MSDFTYTLDADGVATITWDCKDKSMNVMSFEGFEDFEALIDKALDDDKVKGLIITSGKDSFAGGMDLNVLARLKEEAGDNPAKGVFDGVMRIHGILRKLERAGMDPKTNKGGKPVVAAMPGTGMGIGFEIPLACHRIIAADNPKAKIGLPEIMVGIFPGAGGTTRLIRKMGAMAASPFLLEGKALAPAKAVQAGLIDEVVAAGELQARAKEWVLAATDADIVKPWDAKGYKMPGGAPYTPAGFPTMVGANAMVFGKTKGAFPAAKALLAAVYEGALVPFDTALKVEARWFTKVIMDPTSGAMIRSLFLNKQALEKGAVRPAGIPDQSVKKVGVLGAGMMGAGIALVSALAGIEV